jgi:F0F1-type ATP synthase assembly protein I
MMAVISAEILGNSGAGVLIGYLLWKKAGAPWWVLLLTSMAGFAWGMYRVYQRSQKLMK